MGSQSQTQMSHQHFHLHIYINTHTHIISTTLLNISTQIYNKNRQTYHVQEFYPNTFLPVKGTTIHSLSKGPNLGLNLDFFFFLSIAFRYPILQQVFFIPPPKYNLTDYFPHFCYYWPNPNDKHPLAGIWQYPPNLSPWSLSWGLFSMKQLELLLSKLDIILLLTSLHELYITFRAKPSNISLSTPTSPAVSTRLSCVHLISAIPSAVSQISQVHSSLKAVLLPIPYSWNLLPPVSRNSVLYII